MNPLVLIILDGWGSKDSHDGNAIALAKKPNLDRILPLYPQTTLAASGEAVGLPPGTMGNSEVGHLTIGSGRIVDQDLTRINKAIGDKTFFDNPVLRACMEKARDSGKAVHLIGLLSDAGVHSHQNHIFALVRMASGLKVSRLFVHCFSDGRDTPPKSSQKYLKRLQEKIHGAGGIATLVGRYYAMDRDRRWERVQIAYEALVAGKGTPRDDPVAAVEEAYRMSETDEFIKPVILGKGGRPLPRIGEGDSVIFWNFRPDRARELTEAFTNPGFQGFPRPFLKLGAFVCLTQYDEKFPLPVAFPPSRPDRTLAQILSQHKIGQFHTAETEKYAHVTYFLNGGREEPFPGEERLLVPSPRDVPTYDKKPEMNAHQVTDEALKRIRAGCPIVIMNYANPDMVAHSGDLNAAIRAVEVMDGCLGRICDEVLSRKGAVVITADHGNCEQMTDEKGGPHTAHTTHPVPFHLIGDSWRHVALRRGGGLQDVTPTLLEILGIPQPPEMTGASLIVETPEFDS